MVVMNDDDASDAYEEDMMTIFTTGRVYCAVEDALEGGDRAEVTSKPKHIC